MIFSCVCKVRCNIEQVPFSRDWNESEGSDFDHSSDAEDESEENLDQRSTADNTKEDNANLKKSTYFLVDAKETLNITITPSLLHLLKEIFTSYSTKTLSIAINNKSIGLVNDICPHATVELFEQNEDDQKQKTTLISSKTYENEESCPNSPTKYFFNPEFTEDTNEDKERYGFL